MQEQILSFYYPELQFIKLKKNWLGIIKNCSLHSQQINPKSFIKFKKKISKLMNCKFSYLNLIYEVSRLKFILRSITINEDFYQSHQIGIKLNLEKDFENDQFFNLMEDDEVGFLDSANVANDKKLTYKDSFYYLFIKEIYQ